jgi:hypothetical protein
VRVQRRGEDVDDVPVAAARVGLPHLDQRVRDRAAVAVEDAPVHEDPLADGLAAVAQGQVGVLGPDPVLAEHGPGDLREPVREIHRRTQRRAQPGALVVGEPDGRAQRFVLTQVARQVEPTTGCGPGHAGTVRPTDTLPKAVTSAG